MKQILNTSFSIRLMRYFYNWPYRLGQIFVSIYRESRIYGLISLSCSIIRKLFRFSFIGRITEIRYASNLATLDSSRVINYLKNFCVKFKDKIIFSFTRSRLSGSIKKARQEFCLFPVKIASISILTVLMTNVILSIILVKEISLWVWFLRGLLFFVSISGLFCSAGLQDISHTSFFLKCLKKIKF